MEKENMITGILLGVRKDLKIPKPLEEFIQLDDMGIEGFFTMLELPTLNSKIPTEVRVEYEKFRFQVVEAFESKLEEITKVLDEIKTNPNRKELCTKKIIEIIADEE